MIIDGKKIAQDGYEELKSLISQEENTPCLAAILVGNNTASQRYIRQKQKWAAFVGIDFKLFHLEESTSEEGLLDYIASLNQDKNIHGYIVQLPLSEHINEKIIIESIAPKKDVDGFHPNNQGKIVIGEKNGFAPCTPSGIIDILDALNINLAGKNVVVVGRSNIVGKPITNMCINAGATVTSCNSQTKDLAHFTRSADILISAAGHPGLITLDMIGAKTIVIDVGFTIIDGVIHGDADYENIEKNGNYITPVPGGVGALTVLNLMKNTYKAFLISKEYE